MLSIQGTPSFVIVCGSPLWHKGCHVPRITFVDTSIIILIINAQWDDLILKNELNNIFILFHNPQKLNVKMLLPCNNDDKVAIT